MKLNELVQLNEADTSGATAVEQSIVVNWNKVVLGMKGNKMFEGTGISKEAYAKLPAEVKKTGEKIVKNISKTKGISKAKKPAEHYGRGDAPLTPFWLKFGTKDKTPKTDLIIGGKDRISLKIGPSQLMSGGIAESKATLMAAVKSTRTSAAQKEVVAQINSKFDSFVKRGLTKDGTVKASLDSGSDRVLKKADKAHKDMMALLGEYLSSSKSFRTAFAREAMTGNNKFGPKSLATSNKILVGTKEGTANVHLLDQDEYVAKVAEKMRLQVRFKSTSQKLKGKKTGKYSYWSVIGLEVKEGMDHIADMEDQGILTEGKVADTWNMVLQKIKDALMIAWDWAKQSVRNIIEFFEFELASEVPQVDTENFVFPM